MAKTSKKQGNGDTFRLLLEQAVRRPSPTTERRFMPGNLFFERTTRRKSSSKVTIKGKYKGEEVLFRRTPSLVEDKRVFEVRKSSGEH
jgi:hypothetical protein